MLRYRYVPDGAGRRSDHNDQRPVAISHKATQGQLRQTDQERPVGQSTCRRDYSDADLPGDDPRAPTLPLLQQPAASPPPLLHVPGCDYHGPPSPEPADWWDREPTTPPLVPSSPQAGSSSWRRPGDPDLCSRPTSQTPAHPGAESRMYGHQVSSRRRKKRPMSHGIKNVQVSRGRSGYGFTISGQHPCVLSCIVGGSPADLAGLRAGDLVYAVNGVGVGQAPHDAVVRMVGQAAGTLHLQVGQAYNSSDSSEEDYPPRTKSRYPNRVRFRHANHNEAGGGRGAIASRPLPQRPVDGGQGRFYRNHVPVGAESDLSTSLTSPGSSLSEERSRHDYSHGRKRPVYERIGRFSHPPLTDSSTTDMSAEGLAFSMATVQTGPVVATAKISSGISGRRQGPGTQESRSQDTRGQEARVQEGRGQENRAQETRGQETRGQEGSSSQPDPGRVVPQSSPPGDIMEDRCGEEEEAGPMQGEEGEGEISAVVGYIGSIELPGKLSRPNQRLQQLRNAVRRLRVEQKIHTLVLMGVGAGGVQLTGALGNNLALYPANRLAFSGICPDDKRFFGIVTLNSGGGGVEDAGDVGSSCHVFMVDPDLCPHMLHAHKARAFRLTCPPAPGPNCPHFPPSPTALILAIANLYRHRPPSKLDTDIIQSHAFAPPVPQNHRRGGGDQRSSSNSSNSDSGLGLAREDPRNAGEQVCIVDMQQAGGEDREEANTTPTPTRPSSAAAGVSVSRSLGSLPLAANAHPAAVTPRGLQRPLSAFEVRRGLNNSSSSEEWWGGGGGGRVDKLTPRAMPDPATSGLRRPPSAENLRQSMQRLLQARQQQLQDQALSSDSESQASSHPHGHHDPLATRSAFQVPRPVSAPLRARATRMQQAMDHGLGKLSPRAFQHPGPLLRSPSAPPIPYFPHQDSDDDDDDSGSEDDPFVRTIISQFNRDRVLDLGDDNPRRYSEGYALGKQREKERAEVEELHKWTKSGSFRRSHNMKFKANLSQSHESLAVADGDVGGGVGGHRLAGANSVNSVLTSQGPGGVEEAGRVAGWAVSFPRLLNDPAGLAVFTEFLKKEFSQENIEFWTAVEAYKAITDSTQRQTRAGEIFSTYLGSQASQAVNVDSTARLACQQSMDSPTPDTFDAAQKQIFQLMRTDSYSRFLKSDLYKGHLMREMEGHPLLVPSAGQGQDKADGKKKGKGKENEEKRRRSLLPWRQNKKSSVKERSKGKDEKREKEVNNNLKKAGPGIDLSTMRKEVLQPAEDECEEGGEGVRFCRVMMPDRSTTVVCTRAGLTVGAVLGKLCHKRGLSIASVDVFLLGSDKPLDLEEDISTLGSKEVVIERRVLFRLDLPSHKSIGVKAKPNRSIRDVFKPILNKYGHRIDHCAVQLSGVPEFLDLDLPVSDLDNQRVVVTAIPETSENAPAVHTDAVPTRHRRTPLLHLPSRSRGRGGKGGWLEEITNQIFDDLMKGKSQGAHTFDELGVVDLDRAGKAHKSSEEPRSLGLFGLLRKESWGAKDQTKAKSKGRVTFALPRTDSKKKKAARAEEERLMQEKQRAATSDPATSNLVETVDMGLGGVDRSAPDLFDDVHYMLGGQGDLGNTDPYDLDPTHLSDLDDEDRAGCGTWAVSPPFPRLSSFGTPRSRAAARGSDPEEANPYLSMQPVIVDSRPPRDSSGPTSLPSDLRTLGDSISPHFQAAKALRPTKASAGQRSTPTVTSDVSQDPSPAVEQLRPIPARRRTLDPAHTRLLSPRATRQAAGEGSGKMDALGARTADPLAMGRSESPRVRVSSSATPSPTSPVSPPAALAGLLSPRYSPNSPTLVVVSPRQSPSAGVVSPGHSPSAGVTSPRHSPPSGVASPRQSPSGGVNSSRHSSTPTPGGIVSPRRTSASPTLPGRVSSPISPHPALRPGKEGVQTPRYMDPPPYPGPLNQSHAHPSSPDVASPRPQPQRPAEGEGLRQRAEPSSAVRAGVSTPRHTPRDPVTLAEGHRTPRQSAAPIAAREATARLSPGGPSPGWSTPRQSTTQSSPLLEQALGARVSGREGGKASPGYSSVTPRSSSHPAHTPSPHPTPNTSSHSHSASKTSPHPMPPSHPHRQQGRSPQELEGSHGNRAVPGQPKSSSQRPNMSQPASPASPPISALDSAAFTEQTVTFV